MQTCLTATEVELIRDCALQFRNAENLSYRKMLVRIRAAHGDVTYHQLRDFMQGRRKCKHVAAELAVALPLGLVYMGPRLFYRRN